MIMKKPFHNHIKTKTIEKRMQMKMKKYKSHKTK